MKLFFRTLRLAALFSLVLVLFQNCKHELDEPGENIASIDDFYNQNEAERIQEFEINGLRDTFLTTRYGAKISIKAGAVHDGLGHDYSKVKVQFQELRTIKDLVLANRPTQTLHNILETEGCFSLNLIVENRPDILYMRVDRIRIDWPAKNVVDTAMKLFSGARKGEGPMSYFYWESSDDSISYKDSFNAYSIFSPSVEWINIDKFSKDTLGIRSNIITNLPEGFDRENTLIYLIFHDIRSVLSCYEQTFENIPANKQVSIIAIGIKDSKLYFSKQELITPANDKTVDLKMDLSTKDQVKKALEQY